MILNNIEPRAVMEIFETICSIPHGSGNTGLLSNWCVDFAKARGLEHYQDELGNVIIIKPATAGYEAAEPIIIQGHIDMVCQCEPGLDRDMSTQGLELAVDGDKIFARGTTLGGDDGIAAAMALALLDAKDIPHPRLEVVLTVDEETGMYGAAGIDLSPLKGHMLLNIDSEDEGIFTVSCAGGARANCSFPVEREQYDGQSVSLCISGLKGGHSGVEIDKGRANANILMGRLLSYISDRADIRLVSLAGGSADNAIPFECRASVKTDNAAAVMEAAEKAQSIFRHEYHATDAGVCVTAEIAGEAGQPSTDRAGTERIISALTLFPNGVRAMSSDIPGLVETSLNLGILSLEDDQARMSFSVRSSVGSRKDMLMRKISAVCRVLGGKAEFVGEYPAWEFRQDSPLRDKMISVYSRLYGKQPQVVAIHAGLECGLLSAKLENMDAVSFGPDLSDIHTSKESMSISSVQRVWNFLLELLRECR